MEKFKKISRQSQSQEVSTKNNYFEKFTINPPQKTPLTKSTKFKVNIQAIINKTKFPFNKLNLSPYVKVARLRLGTGTGTGTSTKTNTKTEQTSLDLQANSTALSKSINKNPSKKSHQQTLTLLTKFDNNNSKNFETHCHSKNSTITLPAINSGSKKTEKTSHEKISHGYSLPKPKPKPKESLQKAGEQESAAKIAKLKINSINAKKDEPHANANKPLVPLLPLKDWLMEQRSHPKLKDNVILLDPDPMADDTVGPVSLLNPLRCRLCSRKLVREIQTRNHVLNCWLYNKRNHRYCVVCIKTFVSPRSFQRHSQSCFATYQDQDQEDDDNDNDNEDGISNSSKFECDLCQKVFRREERLEFHQNLHKQREKSVDSRPFLCDLCGRAFLTRSHLKEHVKIHSVERAFKCIHYPQCTRDFKTKIGLMKHVQVHSSVKPFSCNYGLGQGQGQGQGQGRGRDRLKTGLKGSRKRKKEGAGACKKSFRTQFELTVHMRTHTGERPYKCPDENCGKGFVIASGLKYHLKAGHTFKSRVGPSFKCDSCGNYFVNKAVLKEHSTSHEGYEPLPCPHVEKGCKAFFKRRNAVKSHEGRCKFRDVIFQV